MRQHMQRLCMVISTFTVLPLIAFAQTGASEPSAAPAPMITVQERGDSGLNLDWQLRARSPISFTPFEMVDPNTGKPVNADDILEINGVKVTAGEYYRRLNEIEQWLNAHGYSLRTDTTFEFYSPQLEQEIADSEQRLRELEAQMPLTGEPYESSEFYPAGCTGDGRWFDTGWFGNSLFGIRFVGQGSYQVCPNAVTLFGDAKVHGHIIGFGGEVISAHAHARIDTPDYQRVNYSYRFDVKVLGHTLWAPSGSGSAGVYTQSWRWSIGDIHWFADVPIACVWVFVPICVYGRVGVLGSLGMNAGVQLGASHQVAWARPEGYLSGYAEGWAGIDLWFLKVMVGVRGVINFLAGSLGTETTGNLTRSFSNGRSCVDFNFGTRLSAHLTALRGHVLLFARGCIWWFGWHCHEFVFPLFAWDGIVWSHDIAGWSRSVRVGCF